MKTKYCNKCGLNKDIIYFSKNNARKDGLQTQCRDCHNQSKRQYELSEKGHSRRLEWKKKWRQTPNGKMSTARNNHKRRIAVDKAFNLTSDEWDSIIKIFHNKCAYCQMQKKLTIDHDWPVKIGGPTDKYNCVPACLSCNSKKRDKLLWVEFIPTNFNWEAFISWKEFCFGAGAFRVTKESV